MLSQHMQEIIERTMKGKMARLEHPQKTTAEGLIQHRESMEKMYAMMPITQGVLVEEKEEDGMHFEEYTPDEMVNDDIILYIHGGGFNSGSARSSRPYVAELSKMAQRKAYSPDYRLSPEYTFPAAPDDAFAFYEKIAKENPDKKIFVAGGSAGGTLALVVTLRAKAKGIKMPEAVFVHSPGTDLSSWLPSRRNNDALDCNLSYDLDLEAKEFYFPGAEPTNPDISPIYGDYENFPPMRIAVATQEILYDDSVLLYHRAKNAGVEVEYDEWVLNLHSFPDMGSVTPEGAEAMKRDIAFIERYSK